MPIVRVIPAIRTPFGIDFFDYRIEREEIAKPGTLVSIPFRGRQIPGLIREQIHTTPFENDLKFIGDSTYLIELPPELVSLIQITAERTFSSEASMLHAWIRRVPQHARGEIRPNDHHHNNINIEIRSSRQWTCRRFEDIVNTARNLQGRILIVTPWKERALAFAKALAATHLDGDLAPTFAWERWINFVRSPASILVTTRIGAWLSICADAVIIDEPEHDDHRQDELAPRFDAREVIRTAAQLRPRLRVIKIGTTPSLTSLAETETACSIPASVIYETWTHGSFSAIPMLTSRTVELIEAGLKKSQSVLMLHPVPGEQRRIRCADCHWTATCSFCTFPLLRETLTALCRSCGRKSDLPLVCPHCQGTNFNPKGIGVNAVKRELIRIFGERTDLNILDTRAWNRIKIPPRSLVVVTNLASIGDGGEDIRRTERLVIAWRRLAASATATDSTLLVQGSEQLLYEASDWLTSEGVQRCWEREFEERRNFGYPPAQRIIKLLIEMNLDQATKFKQALEASLGSSWKINEPFLPLYRSKTRSIRHIIHAIPPSDLSIEMLIHALQPFAKNAIIDLDPIALLR